MEITDKDKMYIEIGLRASIDSQIEATHYFYSSKQMLSAEEYLNGAIETLKDIKNYQENGVEISSQDVNNYEERVGQLEGLLGIKLEENKK